MKANGALRAPLTEKQSLALDGHISRENAGGRSLELPTFAEVSRLTVGPSCQMSIFHQHEYNHFAHLLNRGSSQE